MRRTLRTEWLRLRHSLVLFLITSAGLWGTWGTFRLAGLRDAFLDSGIVAASAVAAVGFVILPIRRYRQKARRLAAQQEWMKAMNCT